MCIFKNILQTGSILHDTYISPVLKLKGPDSDSNEKLFVHWNDDVAGLKRDASGQRYFFTVSVLLGTVNE